MREQQGPRNQEPSEQENRDHYVQALGFPQELRLGEGTTQIGTHELGEMAYEERARELGAPLLPATKDFPPSANMESRGDPRGPSGLRGMQQRQSSSE